MRKISKLMLFLGVLLALPIHAQIITPVKWVFSVKELTNDEAELLFTASIDKTWHLYSQNMPATAIELPLVFDI